MIRNLTQIKPEIKEGMIADNSDKPDQKKDKPSEDESTNGYIKREEKNKTVDELKETPIPTKTKTGSIKYN
jgi:hypothetical protein